VIIALVILGAKTMDEIFKRILDKLKGGNFWIALGFLAAGYVCWRLIGTTETQEKTVLLHQISAALILALLAAGAMWMNHFFFNREPVFTKNLTGILVMRIVGDDARDSLQGDLIENLNAELEKEAPGQRIEVHAGSQTLDSKKGLAAAHEHARAIGKRLNARLVIWGRKIGDNKFHPRITVMGPPKDWSAKSERTPGVQDITELHLPEEIVDEPFYLIHFTAGYSYGAQNNYKDALTHLKAALGRKGASRNELADLQVFTAFCHQSLAKGQRVMTVNLQEAISLYEAAAEVYSQTDQKKWALTQNNLGNAYEALPVGDRAANLEKSIAAYEGALGVYTANDFPRQWAAAQNNLGNAYANLPAGDRTANLVKAIAAHESVLMAKRARDFPIDWATAQNNLGNAYANLPTGDRAANLQNAITALEAALTVFTEKDFPRHWATAQNILGVAYARLPTGDRAANLKKANTAYKASQRIFTEKDFPVDWAMIQHNLGLLYVDTPDGNRRENLLRAKVCFEAALKIYTDSSFPERHRNTLARLANVEEQLRSMTFE